jgi:predicted alpha/beta superfamily hydrolase
MKIALACLALAALPLSGYSQPVKETKKPDAPVAAKPTNPLYQLDRTETFELASPETGKTYKIAVAFPEDYAKAPVGKTYPVIYVIDAQWQFPLIYAITGALMWEKVMPPSLLVGISWKTTNGNLQDLRHQDLIPSGSGDGQAEKFQDFFHNTLFPYIESHYPANQHRTVTGCSTSSLFIFYTMLSRPDMFEGYIGSSPSVHDLRSILEKFPQDGIKQKTRAYMACGGLEDSSAYADFTDRVHRKNLKNLSFAFAPVSNAGHAGVNAECYTRGFQFLFAPYEPPKSETP